MSTDIVDPGRSLVLCEVTPGCVGLGTHWRTDTRRRAPERVRSCVECVRKPLPSLGVGRTGMRRADAAVLGRVTAEPGEWTIPELAKAIGCSKPDVHDVVRGRGLVLRMGRLHPAPVRAEDDQVDVEMPPLAEEERAVTLEQEVEQVEEVEPAPQPEEPSSPAPASPKRRRKKKRKSGTDYTAKTKPLTKPEVPTRLRVLQVLEQLGASSTAQVQVNVGSSVNNIFQQCKRAEGLGLVCHAGVGKSSTWRLTAKGHAELAASRGLPIQLGEVATVEVVAIPEDEAWTAATATQLEEEPHQVVPDPHQVDIVSEVEKDAAPDRAVGIDPAPAQEEAPCADPSAPPVVEDSGVRGRQVDEDLLEEIRQWRVALTRSLAKARAHVVVLEGAVLAIDARLSPTTHGELQP